MSVTVVYLDICALKRPFDDASWFVTTDDRLIRKALEQRSQMQIEVVRPDQLLVGDEEDGR